MKTFFQKSEYTHTQIYLLGRAIRTPVFGDIRYFPDDGGESF